MQLKTWTGKWEPWIWLNAGAVALSTIMVFGLLALIAVRGLGHFWPHEVIEADVTGKDGQRQHIIGQIADEELITAQQLRDAGQYVPDGVEVVNRLLLKVGNRQELGYDFRWVDETSLESVHRPEELVVLEREEWGNAYGRLTRVFEGERVVAEGASAWDALLPRIERARALRDEILRIEKKEIGAINYALERLRLKQRRLELEGRLTPAAMAQIEADRAEQQARYAALQKDLKALYEEIGRDALELEIMNGRTVRVPLAKVVRAYRPNAMGLGDKVAFYGAKLWEFVSDDPREANTEGGIFPAIFGTVLMVLLMSVFVTPLGVVAAVYLREYAHQGALTRTIRIAVNNLAGVPSIVYGVFGLGFFIYFLGSGIDEVFFPEALPSPTFGTPGLLWASLTLAILTLPVVIVATEEGLARIPRSVREGSLALGATKFETLWRVVLPMASPAMMTGMILAIARAAGEVAPLMLVGVVKLAPSLPLDGNYPYLHLDQKFMHLGFHIYDVGFQSPNVEAARPLVYATALLLVLVIALLNLSAVFIRNRLRERYKALEM
ncbi:phosphate ABC transporter permease PstA [Hahella sp. SMD15-11]|uniref:Phosphate transport system permease protein PstA n=1 Tax=Thermohahella caldifontis TaxID=3142973 RepID=A0AB39USD8_9GAMM